MIQLKSFSTQWGMMLFQSVLIMCIATFPITATETSDRNIDSSQDFYQFDAEDLRGNTVPLKRYRGKVSLVVNVASECGYTDQHYRDLVKLQKDLGPTDRFNVLAFPCNQFGAQEPGTNSEIEQFAKRKYSANFPIFSKINVSGDNVPNTWKLLTVESGQSPTWNFWKYLVDGNGHVINAWGPWVDVPSIKHEIIDAVEELTPPDFPYQEHHDEHYDHEEL